MKITRPLINPSPEDFIEENIQEESEQVEPVFASKDQLNLNINTPLNTFAQRVSTIKMSLKRKNELFEISSFWKTPALPFAIVSMIANVITLIMIIIFEFNEIPPKIPFIYNSIEKHWEQSDKAIIIIGLILYSLIESLVIYLNMKIMPKDRRLGLTLNWILCLLNILLLIYIIQIHYLIT